MPIFDFDPAGRREPKTRVHVGPLPSYIHPEQSPTKKRPWRAATDAPFLKSVNVILPGELYDLIWDKIEDETKKGSYAKVILKLQDVLSGTFFTEYIKKGNVLMLSEGRPGIDNVFSLRDGVLRLELDKESYQRSGLQGRPVPSGGRKHMKTRYLIEIELRKPSMLHGKTGFERLVYAAKNVLNQSLTWLFCDLNAEQDLTGSSPLDQHHPIIVQTGPRYKVFEHVLSPPLSQVFSMLFDPTASAALNAEASYELIEWLGLVVLQSPRLLQDDLIDPYLSRYAAPEGSIEIRSLRIIEWQGFIGARWLMRMLNSCIRQSRVHHAQQWLAISASAHRTDAVGQRDGYSIILLPEASSPQEQDLDMDAEPTRSRSGTQGTRTERINNEKRFGGLQKSICFEHFDSLVDS